MWSNDQTRSKSLIRDPHTGSHLWVTGPVITINTVTVTFAVVLWFVFVDSAKMANTNVVVKNADMSEDMQQDAIDCATQALENYDIEKVIAAYIKKEFDKKYSPTWHCIIGRNFGSYVTHETKHFIYFYIGQVAVLLFKSGWEINIEWAASYASCVADWRLLETL